jgi:hypothetical protein
MIRKSIKDSSWIRQSFLLPDFAINSIDEIRRVQTTADYKFTDTSLGGNFALNALPQFTRNADIRRYNFYKGVHTNNHDRISYKNGSTSDNPDRESTGFGMGRFYSEVIDDNSQLIHIRAGVAKFNSLTRFFGNFYSAEASTLSRTARSTGLFFALGQAAGAILTVPLQPLLWAGKFLNFFLDKPSSRYYYLKPAMPLYWNAVTSIVNGIAVNMGVIPRIGGAGNEALDDDINWNQEQIDHVRKLLPTGIIQANGGVDIVSVSTRAQRMANVFNERLEKAMEDAAQFSPKVRQIAISNFLKGFNPREHQDAKMNQKTYLALYLAEGADGNLPQGTTPDIQETVEFKQSYLDKMGAFFEAERKQGSDFVTFRVNAQGSASESFSNSAKASGLAEKINTQSAGSRDTMYNVANGNVGELGGVGTVLSGLVNAGKDLIKGVAEQMSISGVAVLAGTAFVDIPDVWDSSTADVGRSTFTIPLRAPYGHNYSRLQNLIIPMSALLALCLPLSTGKQSYTAPFLLELFNQGRAQVRLGMVESLTFTRGVGETGWLKKGRFMGVDCNLTIIDLSKVLHMPINPGFSLTQAAAFAAAKGVGEGLNGLAGLFGGEVSSDGVAATLMQGTYDDDNKYTDYLATLGSLPLEAQINTLRKFKLRATEQAAKFQSYTSPAHIMQSAMGGFTGDIIKAISAPGSKG